VKAAICIFVMLLGLAVSVQAVVQNEATPSPVTKQENAQALAQEQQREDAQKAQEKAQEKAQKKAQRQWNQQHPSAH
jgi:hypothetical protein